MSTYLNNPINMCACAAGSDSSVRVTRSVELVDTETGEPAYSINGMSDLRAGRTYKAVDAWSVCVGYLTAARYKTEEAAGAAYKAAVEAIRNGETVHDLPTEGAL